MQQLKHPDQPSRITASSGEHLSHHGILSLAEVKTLLGRSRSAIYAAMNPRSRYYQPRFPKRVKLSERRVGWRASEVFAYLDNLPTVEERGNV